MPNASLVWEMGSCGRRRSGRGSPVAFSCESSSILVLVQCVPGFLPGPVL